MKLFAPLGLMIGLLLLATGIQAQAKRVYEALSSEQVTKLDETLNYIKGNADPAITAYEGALLMKKAGLIKGPGNKLSTFKEGREKLEKAIEMDSENGEYRFLRLMIQENAPDMLGYNKNIQEDAAVVQKKYNELSDEVKQAVQSYSDKSKALKGIDFTKK